MRMLFVVRRGECCPDGNLTQRGERCLDRLGHSLFMNINEGEHVKIIASPEPADMNSADVLATVLTFGKTPEVHPALFSTGASEDIPSLLRHLVATECDRTQVLVLVAGLEVTSLVRQAFGFENHDATVVAPSAIFEGTAWCVNYGARTCFRVY